jgi:hypothetical protein
MDNGFAPCRASSFLQFRPGRKGVGSDLGPSPGESGSPRVLVRVPFLAGGRLDAVKLDDFLVCPGKTRLVPCAAISVCGENDDNSWEVLPLKNGGNGRVIISSYPLVHDEWIYTHIGTVAEFGVQ